MPEPDYSTHLVFPLAAQIASVVIVLVLAALVVNEVARTAI